MLSGRRGVGCGFPEGAPARIDPHTSSLAPGSSPTGMRSPPDAHAGTVVVMVIPPQDLAAIDIYAKHEPRIGCVAEATLKPPGTVGAMRPGDVVESGRWHR